MNVNTSLTTLNDFIFCPYSIYLHKTYMETDKEIEILILSRARQTHTLHARNDIQIERLPQIASTNMRQFSRSV